MSYRKDCKKKILLDAIGSKTKDTDDQLAEKVGVSKATVSRYILEFVKEGRITRDTKRYKYTNSGTVYWKVGRTLRSKD